MTYEAWRISYQSSEHAARAAYAKCVQLHVRLESAEKERDWNAERLEKAIEECTALRLAVRHEADCVDAAKAEIAALRAKITEMEKQKPVAWLHETRRDSDVVTNAVKCMWQRARPMSLASYTIPLYLGAQPAPSVPVAAIEKVLAEVMEIAVSNGASSVSMPDEYVEIAAWLHGLATAPKQGVR